MFSFIKRMDWFSPALLLMILLAKIFPGPGLVEGFFSLQSFANFGIAFIFFLYGLRLSFDQLKGSVSNWRLHLVIQSTTFIIFPLFVLLFRGFFEGSQYYTLWLGVFYLAALPSTVSSAVVMISLARGNVSGGIFNATVSSLAGILITPLWMGVFLSSDGMGIEMGPVFARLGYQIFLPLVAGVSLHRWIGAFAIKHSYVTRYFDQSVILAVVYTSFCISFHDKIFSGYTSGIILLLIVFLFLLFIVINGAILGMSGFLKLPKPDLITGLFCGSTKSLMHGSVMAGVLFMGMPDSGIFLLPVLLYHAMQLTITAYMAQRFRASQ